jgi:hypothetical protein
MPGLMRGVARTAVVAGTATAVSNRVSRRQANRWADQADQQYYEQQQYQQQAVAAAPPPQAAAGLGTNTVEQLKQLAELRDQGILTDEEFNAQKAKLLAS